MKSSHYQVEIRSRGAVVINIFMVIFSASRNQEKKRNVIEFYIEHLDIFQDERDVIKSVDFEALCSEICFE
jgi:hypothetical protein